MAARHKGSQGHTGATDSLCTSCPLLLDVERLSVFTFQAWGTNLTELVLFHFHQD